MEILGPDSGAKKMALKTSLEMALKMALAYCEKGTFPVLRIPFLILEGKGDSKKTSLTRGQWPYRLRLTRAMENLNSISVGLKSPI